MKSRRGIVYLDATVAGTIEETQDGYTFSYDRSYLQGGKAQAVSLTLPLRTAPFTSPTLFPFFSGLLAEGALADIQCRFLRIDERDLFGRLLATCHDTIGAVTVRSAPAP